MTNERGRVEGMLDGVGGHGGDDLAEGFAGWGEGKGVLVGREGLGGDGGAMHFGRKDEVEGGACEVEGVHAVMRSEIEK